MTKLLRLTPLLVMALLVGALLALSAVYCPPALADEGPSLLLCESAPLPPPVPDEVQPPAAASSTRGWASAADISLDRYEHALAGAKRVLQETAWVHQAIAEPGLRFAAYHGPAPSVATDTVSSGDAAPPPATVDRPSTTPPVPDPSTDAGGWASKLYDNVHGGHWAIAAGLLLIGIVALLRWVGRGVKWFHTDRGAVLLTLLVSFLGSVGMTLAKGGGVGLQTFVAAITLAWTASGGLSHIKRLIWPQH